jgi:hypothetical protein
MKQGFVLIQDLSLYEMCTAGGLVFPLFLRHFMLDGQKQIAIQP